MELFQNVKVLSLEQATVVPSLTYRLPMVGLEIIRLEHPVYGDPNRMIGENALGEEKMNAYFKDKVFWQSFVPLVSFDKKNKLTGIKLYPIVLGQNEPVFWRGIPRLAGKEQGKEILQRLQKLSAIFKTKVVIEKGVGKVVL